MKILIVTAWYYPFIHPRAHRWTVLAEHWAAAGHEVQVLTARVRGHAREEHLQGVRVYRVGFDSLKEWVYFYFGSHNARGRVGHAPQHPGCLQRGLQWIYKTIWKNLFFPDDACVWYFPAKRKLRQLLVTDPPDVVISVSLPFTGHLLTWKTLSQINAKARPRWLADIGDPFSFQAMPPNNTLLFGRINRRLEQQILQAADKVVVTTEATRQRYQTEWGNEVVDRMVVIPPVFAEMNRGVKSAKDGRVSATLKMGYFGAFYAPTRTPDAFLALLQQIQQQNPALRNRMEIHFYGEIFPEFYRRLQPVPGIVLHGLCSRSEAWAAMQEMDILINIGNTTDFQLPSKAAEYLASGKPILHLCHVKNDPFTVFFKDYPLIINLILNTGSVSTTELETCIQWLESNHPPVSDDEIKRRLLPNQVENVAAAYFYLFKPIT